MQIIKYEIEEEKQTIIAEKLTQGFTLVAVSNITEGNFLGFVETNTIPIPQPAQPTNQGLLDNQMTLMNGMVDIYMSQMGF